MGIVRSDGKRVWTDRVDSDRDSLGSHGEDFSWVGKRARKLRRESSVRSTEGLGGERSQLVPVTDVSDQETGSVGGGAWGKERALREQGFNSARVEVTAQCPGGGDRGPRHSGNGQSL